MQNKANAHDTKKHTLFGREARLASAYLPGKPPRHPTDRARYERDKVVSRGRW